MKNYPNAKKSNKVRTELGTGDREYDLGRKSLTSLVAALLLTLMSIREESGNSRAATVVTSPKNLRRVCKILASYPPHLDLPAWLHKSN